MEVILTGENSMDVQVGDSIITKKPHPCGSSLWEIIRTGADFKIKCTGCGRVVMLSYMDFKKRVKRGVNERDNRDGQEKL